MRADKAFTLLEILLAFAILAIGVTLAATGLRRHISTLRIVESSFAASRQAQGQVIREIVRRADALDLPPLPADESYTPSLKTEPFTPDVDPIRGVPMERVTSEVTWGVRGQPRELHLSVGFAKPRDEEPQA